MAYDPSLALTDGTIPAGGFMSHVACVAAINTVLPPPVVEAGIALLEEVYPVPCGTGGLQACPPRGRQTALSGWGPVASAAMQWGCPFLQVGTKKVPETHGEKGGRESPVGSALPPPGVLVT